MKLAGETGIDGVKPDDPVITLPCATCKMETFHALTFLGLRCLCCEELYFAVSAIPSPSTLRPTQFVAQGVIRN